MNEKNAYYIVGRDLSILPVTALLAAGERFQRPEEQGSVQGDAEGPPIALSPDGTLAPDVLYESSADPRVRFYLPRYSLRVVDGRYTTRLRWRGPDDDPEGPLAFLDVELVAEAPPAEGFLLQEIEHQAVVRIGYQMPVEMAVEEGGAPASPPPAPPVLQSFRFTPPVAPARPTLWIEAGALEPAGPGVRRCRLPVVSKPDFDRLYQILTEADLAGRLEIRCFATVGRRTWRQILLGPIDRKAQLARGLAVTPTIDPALLKPVKAVPPGRPPVKIPGRRRIEPEEATRVDAVRLQDVSRVQVRPEAVETRFILRGIGPADSARILQPDALAVEPSALRSAALRRSDVTVKVRDAEVRAVPARFVVDRPGVAALLRVPAEARQEVAPFCFPVETNAYVFDVPGDLRPTTHHILIRNEVRGADGAVLGVFYQDSAFPDQFYYQPQEFRLPRLDVPPYLPDLRVLFLDLLGTDGADADGADASDPAGEASLFYRVQVVYRARPYIDPGVLDRLQQQVPGGKARFTALVSESSRLTLRLPEDETEGRLTAVPRTDAEVRLEEGIVDCVELSQTEFERVFSFFQAGSGLGMEGDVEATLLGNTTARIPVRLSLRETTGPVFGSTYRGPVGPVEGGLHRVTLLNRLESPVRIDHFHRVVVAPGVSAFPQIDPGAVVPAGGTLDVDYRVTPEGAEVASLEPVLSTVVESDPAALWPRLFTNQGYTGDTFTVEVSIEPDFFGAPPAGVEPLAGVEVEFDSGAVVVLTAAAPRATATLRMPLLARLLGAAEARQYRYRVTNLHGDPASLREGAQTDFLAGEGEAPLSVVPAGA